MSFCSLEQESQLEDLLRYARYKDCVLRSLQGPGPSPVLESELVQKGHARETVRFFLVCFCIFFLIS